MDALALYEMLLSDPNTYTGAKNIGALIPLSATDLILQSMFTNGALLTSHGDSPASYAPSEDEKKKAAQHMSSLFT